MITRSIKVFLGAPQMVAPPVSVSQMDTGWKFSFTAFAPDGQVWTPPDGASVTLEGKKLDNSYFSYAGTIEDGKALFDVTAQMVAIPGPVTCELRFYRNAESLGTANFEMMVEESPTSSLVLSQDEINVLNQLVADAIEDMDERKDAAAASAAAAATSETNAAGSAADALASETAAAASAVNAAACELDAAGSASSAASSAAAAAASESAAAESESQAEGYAASAESAASAASGSESAAAASATAAGQSRAAAESAAAIAVSASTAAQTSANNAAASETNARASEQSVEASKVSAASSASSASSSASSASGSASTATTAAQTATTKAGEATTAASTATSASTAAVSAKTAAEAAQAAAEAVLESIPEDYSELSDEVGELKSAINEIDEAIDSTVIHAPKVVTVAGNWRKTKLLTGLTLEANTTYKFFLTYDSTVNVNAYFRIFDSEDTELVVEPVGHAASYTVTYTNTTARTGCYCNIEFGAVASVQVTAYAQKAGYNSIETMESSLDTSVKPIPLTGYMKFIDLSGTTADVNTTATSSSGINCAVATCSGGEVFTVNAEGGGSQARAWAFVSSNGTILAKANANTNWNNTRLIAPFNSAYLVINTKGNLISYRGDTFAESGAKSEGFYFEEGVPTLKVGYTITNGAYVASANNMVFDEDTYYQLADAAEVTFSATTTHGIYVRFYDANLNHLGNGGQNMATSGTVFILAAMNANLAADAKYMKIGGYKDEYDPSKVTVANAKIGKVFKVGAKRGTVNVFDDPSLKWVGVYSPMSERVNNYLNETAQHKYFTLLFGTDFHGDMMRMRNMRELASQGKGKTHYQIYDVAVNGGDIRHYNLTEPKNGIINGVAMGGIDWVHDTMSNYSVPLITVVGNHDPGFSTSLDCLDNDGVYDAFVADTALANDGKKSYGYLDNAKYKVRLIVLYNYDSGIVELAKAQSMSQLPAQRGYGCMYSQAQLNWLAATLNSVPQDYRVIIISHNAPLYREGYVEAFSDFTDINFNIATWKRNAYAVQGFRTSDGGGMGVIADIVQAYINKTTINATYNYVGNDYWSADLSYWTPVTANYDFTNANGAFAFYLCGHVHRNVAIRCTMTGYEDQLLIAADTSSCENFQQGSSIGKSKSLDTLSENCLLSVILDTDADKVHLVSVGANIDGAGTEKVKNTIDLP